MLIKSVPTFRGLLKLDLEMLQRSTESSVPSIQNNKQYHIELTGEFVCLIFLAEYKRLESSETGSVLTDLQKYKELYLPKSVSPQKKKKK